MADESKPPHKAQVANWVAGTGLAVVGIFVALGIIRQPQPPTPTPTVTYPTHGPSVKVAGSNPIPTPLPTPVVTVDPTPSPSPTPPSTEDLLTVTRLAYKAGRDNDAVKASYYMDKVKAKIDDVSAWVLQHPDQAEKIKAEIAAMGPGSPDFNDIVAAAAAIDPKDPPFSVVLLDRVLRRHGYIP